MTEFAGILHGAGRNEQKKLNWVVNNVEECSFGVAVAKAGPRKAGSDPSRA